MEEVVDAAEGEKAWVAVALLPKDLDRYNVHIDNMEMGKYWYKQVVQQLALASIDADGDMHMMWWDLDKGCPHKD